jgi:O-antigen/teichoic acid export membrane protein
MVLVLLVGLYTSRVVLRVLGVEDYGIYNIVGSVVVFLQFLKMALTNATYRYLAFEIGKNDLKRLREVYSMSINCHVILAIFIWCILEIAGVWFLNNKLNIPDGRLNAANWVFQFSLLSFCVSVIQTPFNSSIIAHERMDFYAIVSIVEVFLKLGIVYVLIVSPIDKLISYGFLQLVITLLIGLCYLVYCLLNLTNCVYIRFWDKTLCKELISYSGWSLLVNASDVIANQSMSIFFNIFFGVIANAAMGITQQVTSQLGAFLGTFTQSFNPQIIKSYAAKEYDYFMKLIFSASKISYLLFIFIAIPIIANIEFVLDIWLGEYPALTPVFIRIIVLYSVFESTQKPFLNAVHATGRIKVHQIMMSVIKLSSIPVMYLVLKEGMAGYWMLIVWVTFTFIWCTVRTIYMHYLIQMSLRKYFYDVLVKILVVTALTAPFTFYMAKVIENPLVAFFASSCYSVIAISLSVWFYALNESEKNIIKNFGVIKAVCKYFKR